MKPIHLLLAALVALLVGGGAGYFIGAEGAQPARVAPVDNSAPVEAGGPESVETPGKPADPAARAETPAPVAPVVAGNADALAAWLASLAGSKPDSGTGRIWGRVAQKDGTPVADAAVTATPSYPQQPPRRTDDEPSVAETVEANARRTLFARSGRLETRTDADGRFEFATLGEYEFWLNVKAKGFEFEQTGARRRTGNVKPDAEVNFLAKPVCVLDLDVRLPDGTQPKTASPMLARGNSSRGGYWRPEQTTANHEPGKATLTVKAGEHEQYQSDPMEIELVEQQTLKLTIQLKAVTGILCVMTLPAAYNENNRPNVRLQADPPAEPPTGAPPRGIRDARNDWETGNMAFLNLKPGPYRVMAVIGNQVVAWQDVALAEEFKTVTLAIPEPDKKDFIVVRVSGPDGKAAKGVQLNISTRSEGYGSSGNSRVIEQPDGSFWVSRSQPDGRRVADGKPWWYEISATCEAYGVKSEKYPSDATHELAIQFDTPATLTILIPGASTHALRARLRPNLSRQEGTNSWNGVSLPGRMSSRGLESDSLKYGPLSPGKYRFSLSLTGGADDEEWYGGRGGPLGEIAFDVTSGENTQSYAIPVLCKLTVVVADPKAVQSLNLRAVNGGGQGRSAWGENIKERTVFEGVPAGEWVLSNREGEQRVNLTGDMEVKLNIRKYDCIILSGIKAGGKIEALGLRDGDKIVRVDGTEVENAQVTMEVNLLASLAKDSTTWTVLRAGAQTDVTFSGKELMKIMSDRSESGERERFNPKPGMRE